MKKLLVLVLCALPTIAGADGLIKIKDQAAAYLRSQKVEVTTEVRNQVALTVTRQTFHNTTGQFAFMQYGFPAGINATVTRFEWWQNGEHRVARITGQPQDSVVSDPGDRPDVDFIEYLGDGPFIFTFNDSLPADSTLVLELTYMELLKYNSGQVHYRYPLDMKTFATTAIDFSFAFALASQRQLLDISSRSHPAMVFGMTDSTATTYYENPQHNPEQDVVIEFQLNQQDLGVFMLSHKPPEEDGYFLMLAEPDPSTPQDEVIVKIFTFIVDVSGSMIGGKIEQAKAAARFTVENLNAEDKFNIIRFNTSAQKFRDQPVQATLTNIQDGVEYIDNLTAGGATNMEAALLLALAQDMPDTTANIFIFLTDGIAPLNQQTIIDANTKDVRIFVFGIGTDVNKSVLTQLAANNNGLAEFLENDLVSERISEFYSKIRNPLLQNIAIDFEAGGVHEIYPLQIPDIYVGQQLAVAGRYTTAGPTQLTLRGSASGAPHRSTYAVVLSADSVGNVFIPKMWAKFKIDALLVLMSGVPEGSNQWNEWKAEIIRLSERYGIASPFSSFTEPPDLVDVRELADAATPLPVSFMLEQNHPNPFNPETKIVFSIPGEAGKQYVIVKVFDVLGRLVRVLFAGEVVPGRYEVVWDGRDAFGRPMASGAYLYVLEAGETRLLRKMLLLR